MALRTFLLVSMFFDSLTVLGQEKINTNDSLQIKNKIESFYTWYADLIKTTKVNEFNPRFIETDGGMTSLDFTNYRSGLKRNGFTDNHIERRIKKYSGCVDNLKNIPYKDFLKFTDLDQFEDVNCDFSNGYEWIGSMEPHDGAELTNLNLVTKDTVIATIKFYNLTKDNSKHYWGQATMTFIRIEEWRIDDFN